MTWLEQYGRIPYERWTLSPLRARSYGAGPAAWCGLSFSLVGEQRVVQMWRAGEQRRRWRDGPLENRTFYLLFLGVGLGAGADLGLSESDENFPSEGGVIHFMAPSRCALDFSGEGWVLDLSAVGGYGPGWQALGLNWPLTIIGGVPAMLRNIWRLSRLQRPLMAAVATASGESSGFSLGATLFDGYWSVSDAPPNIPRARPRGLSRWQA